MFAKQVSTAATTGGRILSFERIIHTVPELVSDRDFLRTQALALGSSPHPTTPSQSSFGMAVAKLKLYSTWEEGAWIHSLSSWNTDRLGVSKVLGHLGAFFYGFCFVFSPATPTLVGIGIGGGVARSNTTRGAQARLPRGGHRTQVAGKLGRCRRIGL